MSLGVKGKKKKENKREKERKGEMMEGKEEK